VKEILKQQTARKIVSIGISAMTVAVFDISGECLA
jgi:hypothetical protein